MSSQGVRCPLCGGEARRAFLAADLNRAASEERFEYARCRSCGALFQPSPPEDLAPYYPSEYYELAPAAELDRLAASQEPIVAELRERSGLGRLIEIGPGEGVFARAARNAGFEVTAIEMDARACAHLRETVGVQAVQDDEPERALAALPPSRVVVMWHVVEHLRRPWETIEAAAGNLQEGGVLALATPNPQALQFRLLGRRWAHLDAPRHLFLLPREALVRRCEELGLELVRATADDDAARHWNRFGWEYALRRAPRSRPGSPASRLLAGAIARALAPLERSGDRGCAYTALFRKRAAT